MKEESLRKQIKDDKNYSKHRQIREIDTENSAVLKSTL